MEEKSGHSTKIICGEEYRTAIAAAQMLGISKATLLCLCRANQISHIKIGRMFAFKEKWLKEFVREKTKEGAYNESRYAKALRRGA